MIVKLDKYGWSLDDFQYVKVGEGITTIGDMAFVFMDNIKKYICLQHCLL